MSYLDTPRIHIAGRFFADPSTVNNDPQHYVPTDTRPSPWQEPNGNHYFKLQNCTVRSARDVTGADAPNDPVIGVPVETTDTPSPAKLVDLDVYQQGVSTVYGLQLKITLPNGTAVIGTMDPASLNGGWFTAVLPDRGWDSGYGWGSHGGDGNASGAFQTLVRVDQASWPNTGSTVLQQLHDQCAVVNNQLLLSFKFVTDDYRNVADSVSYRTGRFIGTLGPASAGELVQAPGPRWLSARPLPPNADWYIPSFYDAPFKVDFKRKKLVIDLGNSICRQSPGGPPVDLGTLHAVVKVLDGPAIPLGQVNYSAFAYDNNADISELDLTDNQLSFLRSHPVSLVMKREDLGPQEILSESFSGLAWSVDNRVIRMAGTPGTTATTSVQVTRWGIPARGVQLALRIEPVYGTTPGATVPPTNPGDTPQAVGVLEPPSTFITRADQNGIATVQLQVLKDPGSRTPQLDGQLYFVIVYDPQHPPDFKASPHQEQMISCLVWSQYAVNTNPSWETIQGLMQPYVKLYPGMTNRLDLSDLHTFTIFAKNPPWIAYAPGIPPEPYLGIDAGAIAFYLTRDFTDPRYMPVTRDLSLDKLHTILHFIKNLQSATT